MKRLKSISIGLFATFIGILWITGMHTTLATSTQNDSSGYFLVDFNGNQNGLAPNVAPFRQNINVNTSAGFAELVPGETSGYLYTSTITPASFTNWGSLQITGTYSSAQDVRISLTDCSATPVPIAGFQNMNPGPGGSIPVSGLNATTNPCVRIKAELVVSGGVRPTLDAIRINWTPLPVLSTTLSADSSVSCGNTISYSVGYTLSYVDDTNVVLWAPLPSAVSGSYDPTYGQNLATSFVSATSGGQYTAGQLTLNGVTVPAGSVYWVFPTMTAGTTGTLSFIAKTTNGTQNGVIYQSQSSIDSQAAATSLSDSNTSLAGAQMKQTTVSCSANASVSKTSLGTIPAGGSNWIYNGGSFTPVVTYSLVARNEYAPTGRETLFLPSLKDSVADIIDTLIGSCSVSGSSVASKFTINNGGSLDTTAKTISWNGLTSLQPGQSTGVSYAVDYTGCPDGLDFDNTVTLTAANSSAKTASARVKTGFNPTATAAFATGEASGAASSITTSADDLTSVVQYYGATYSYLLQSVNTGPLALGNVTSFSQIKPEVEFVGASQPTAIGGTLYYNTDGASNSDTAPPDYDPATGVFGPSWTTTMPSPASDVKWVASVAPCLDSPLFPATSGSCHQKSTSSITTIQVKVLTPSGACDVVTTTDKGLYYAYQAGTDVTNATLTTLTTPLSLAGDPEVSHIGPAIANLSTSVIAGPTSLETGTNGTYNITITNNGADASTSTTANITLPTLLVNGTTQPIDFVSATGGAVSLSGLPNTVSVDVGTIPAGSSKVVSVILSAPRGIPASSVGTLTVALSGTDGQGCSVASVNTTKQTTFTAEPSIISYKEVDESLADPAGDIHYKIHFNNIGESPTTQTYVVDKIPSETVFHQAFTSGTDSNGTTFTCVSCSVYFADNNPALPPSITPLDPFTTSRIASYFTLGTQVSPGVWTSPFGAATKYVAYKVDNPSVGGGLVPTSSTGMVGLTVTNDQDGSGSSTDGSAIGTVITNQPAVVTAELAQAIGNQVSTTILSDPGLRLTKTSDKNVVYAGESFNWNISYHNDSTTSDSSVVLEDTVPGGFTVNSVYHSWNDRALSGGATPSGEQDITNNSNTTITNNPDGTTTVRVTISSGLRGGDLALLEGGTLRLAVSSSTALPSGLSVQNTVEGCYAKSSTSYCVYASDSVSIQNPDLWLRKTVDKPAPVAGDTLTYTLTVSNEGYHEATQVHIQDTLPAGLCYASGTAHIVSPAGWSIGEPTVAGGCGSVQTLTWDSSNNNAIKGPSTGSGVVPSNSPDILISYQVQVDGSVASGTTLTNGAAISTNLTENATYSNGDNRSVTVPHADPYVIKNSPPLSLPGASFAYSLTYGNGTAQPTTGSYIIDTLPDTDSDGHTDVSVTSVVPSNGEMVYYNSATSGAIPPTFDPNNPTSGGWSATPSATTNYIAIVIGSLPGNVGPYAVTINAEMTDPTTLEQTAPGITMTNKAEIHSASADNDSTNNVSFATTSTPSLDLSITKTADNEGAYPGAQPGGYLAYTVTYKNNGTVNACDVHVEDMLPVQIDGSSIIHNFTDLSGLVDSAGSATKPVDSSNSTIDTQVAVTYTRTGNTLRWDLGDGDTCLRPGAHGAFSIYVQIMDSTPDSTTMTNTAIIGEDSAGIEDIMNNNTASSTVSVYRANVKVQKTGVASGLDMQFGTADDSTTVTNPNEMINYTVTYDNSGNTAANDVVIADKIPANSCFVLGSLSPPAGSTLQFSTDNQSTWTYTPIGSAGDTDCSITHFRIVFLASLPAPATFAAENSTEEFQAMNSVKSFNDTQVIEPGAVSLQTNGIGSFGIGNVNNNSKNCFDENADPILICTPDDLNKIRDFLDRSYLVANDLDFKSYDQSAGTSYTSGSGWEPISGFIGKFDGNHAIVDNLFISRPGSGQSAFFGNVDSGAEIHDIKFTNASVFSGGSSAILISNGNSIRLSNVHVQGSVEQDTSADKLFAGLAAYLNASTVTDVSADVELQLTRCDACGVVFGSLNNTTVNRAKASGLIASETLYASGGFVGVLENGSAVQNSYTTADVTTTIDGKEVGGFVGTVRGASVVRYSYANGSVVKADNVTGGFAGYNEGAIEDSFALNKVSGGGDIGGFVSQGSGTLKNVYYNEDPASPVGVCFTADPANSECHTIVNDANYFVNLANAPMDVWQGTNWLDNSAASKPPILSWETGSYVPNGNYTTLVQGGSTMTAWDKFIYTQDLPMYQTNGVTIPGDYIPYDWGDTIQNSFGSTDATDTFIHTFYGIVNGNGVGSVNIDDGSPSFDGTHGGVAATDTQKIQTALDSITNSMGYPGQAIYSITSGNQITFWLSPALAAEVGNGTFVHMYAGTSASPGGYTSKVDIVNQASTTFGDILLPSIGDGSTAQTHITLDIQGVHGSTCDGTSLIGGAISTSNPTEIIDISGIPASVSELCVTATLDGAPSVSPLLTSWIATYKQSDLPQFTYQTKVNNDSFVGNTLTNTAAISTTTPETSTSDNNAQYTHVLQEQDLRIQKTVDKASINLADIAAQTPLTYTLTVNNTGPSDAQATVVEDTLPTFVQAPISLDAGQTSNNQTVKCQYDAVEHSIYCDDDGDPGTPSQLHLAKNESMTITVVVPVSTSITLDDTVVNFAEVSSATYDTNMTNNTATATTVVGDFANVAVTKSGPQTSGINKDITYTLTAINNGNVNAENVVLVDMLPTEDQNGDAVLGVGEDLNNNGSVDTLASFVSATVNSGPGSLVCMLHEQQLYCNSDGSQSTSAGVSLAPGESIEITVILHANNNLDMLVHQSVLLNQLTAYTSTPQTNINDDYASATTAIVATDLSSISGKVWVDNANNGDDVIYNADDTPLASARLFISGIDIYGVVYGPDKSAYPAEYEEMMADLRSQCNTGEMSVGCPVAFSDNGPYTSGAAYPAGYIAMGPQTTGSSGDYSFTGLRPGVYNVLEQQPEQWRSIASDGGFLGYSGTSPNLDSSRDGEGSAETGNTNFVNKIGGYGSPTNGIVLYEGDTSVQNNFIEGGGGIGNHVYKDNNNSGTHDAGDTPFPTVEITLWHDVNKNGVVDGSDTPRAVQMTDANGAYQFNGLELASTGGSAIQYIVKVSDSTHATNGYAAVLGALNTDENGQQPTGVVVELSQSNGQINYADFGYAPLAHIGDRVWYDTNKNGLQDAGEGGIAGIEVRLVSGSSVVATTTTDGLGHYDFYDIVPGKYTIAFVYPSGYISTTQTVGSNTLVDSDASSTGITNEFTVKPGEFLASIDAGLYAESANIAPSVIQGTIWYDAVRDNVRDSAEPLLPSISLKLLNSSGTLIATTASDSSGAYAFQGLLPGDYVVEVVPSTGLQLVSSNVGTDGTIDSNFQTANSRTTTLSVTSGNNQTAIDAGLYLPGNISLGGITGMVWNDTTRNNIHDGSETGIPGQHVELLSGSTVVATAVSDVNGHYAFNSLLPGNYQVKIIPNSGWSIVAANQGGNESSDSDINPYTFITGTYTVVSGDMHENVDAGFYSATTSAGSIGGSTWVDADSNGVMTNGELPKDGAMVTLYDETGSLVASMQSAADGSYEFINILPGNYYVVFTPPTATALTLQNSGSDDTIDSDAHPSTGATAIFSVSSGQAVQYMNAGFMTTAVIGNQVFYDYNGNGIYEPSAGERGIDGVQIDIYQDTDGTGSLTSADTPIQSALTDSSGHYQFTGLAPGDTYIIVANTNAVVPAGYVQTAGTHGVDNNSQDAQGYVITTSAASLSNYSADFGWQPNAHLVDPPSIKKSVTPLGEQQLEWRMVWINQSASGPVLASLNDPIASGQQYVAGSISCEARGVSSTTECSVDTNNAQPVIHWAGEVGADADNLTEEQAQNEIIISFRVTLASNVSTVENQACGHWDENGDNVVDSNDFNIANNIPVCSDDPSTAPSADVTRYVVPQKSAATSLSSTGQNITIGVISAAILLLSGIIIIMLNRKRSRA